MAPKIPSPYFIETVSGKLELTKGTYLTLQRRKEHVSKTLRKTKQIKHNFSASQKDKLTKKSKITPHFQNNLLENCPIANTSDFANNPSWRQTRAQTKLYRQATFSSSIKTKSKVEPHNLLQTHKQSGTRMCGKMGLIDKTGNYHYFPISTDMKVYNSNVPCIEMEWDNDQESEWVEIDYHVKNIVMGLNVALYDRKYGRL